ncbi:MAG TPA: hypothetical protein VGB76_10910 [Pyrinomonadaceae bacterium]
MKEPERLLAALRFCCYAAAVLVPFYLLIRANSAWTPHPRFFPDDAVYARMCWPSGFIVYWHDFGFYRLLAVPAYALSNRAVMRASLSPVPFTLIASAFATLVFVWTCVSVGLSRRRGVLLAGVLLSSPLLLETLNFWSGTFNYALVLLLLAAQLRACVWARRRFVGRPSRGYLVTACGALIALLTYEIALPFILATSAFYTRRGRARELLSVCIACAALLAFVGALVWAGVYWPLRFRLMAEQLASAVSGTPAPNLHAPSPATATPLSTLGRAQMYASLLFSFVRTGLLSPSFWGLAGALAGLGFLARTPTEKASHPAAARETEAQPPDDAEAQLPDDKEGRLPDDKEGRLPRDLVALGFAFSFGACVVYLLVTRSLNARYVAFLLIYGAATLAWTKWRAASFALASLLLLQAAVAASLPVHMRDVELAAKGEINAARTGRGDLISVDGRLTRGSWGKRFFAPEPIDLLKQPLNSRACRYAAPCEECR